MLEFVDLCMKCGYYLSKKGEHVIYDGTYTFMCDHGEELPLGKEGRRRKLRELLERAAQPSGGGDRGS